LGEAEIMFITNPEKNGRSRKIPVFLASLLFFLTIASAGNAPAQTIEFDFNFRNGANDWTSDFANYPPGTNQNGFYQLDSGIRYAPRKLTHVPIRAYYLQGNSFSASLMMFLKRRLTAADGVLPGQAYRLEYTMKLASNAATGCIGIGSPPGEGVFLRAGGSPSEPLAVLEQNGWLRINLDLLTMTSPAGHIANGIDCEIAFPYFPYAYIDRSVQHAQVTAAANGDLWLFVATISGFEGQTRLYYQRITVRLVPV
jgi:hypothetical protein